MTWIPSASSNRSWNIRKSYFLPSCPHQVCEYYVLGYCSTATIEVCVIWLTTQLKRRRRGMNPKETSNELWDRQWSSSGAVGDLTVQSRRHHFFSTACLSVRRATVRTLCILKVRAIALHSRKFFAIPSRRWWCRSVIGALKETLLQVPWRLVLFKDAAGSLWRHSPGVTAFFNL